MKISENWLHEWVNPSISTEDLVAQLTMAGLEVDGVESVAKDFTGVVVGEIIDIAPHPDAEKLRVCQVRTATDENTQVVCGASNARLGLKAPFAQVGAVLPEDFKIKKAKLRGVESFGMLCGASELGLEDQIDGLMELPADAPLGQDFRAFLQLDDNIIDIDLTPNRGDCLSVRGVAREVGVLNKVAVTEVNIAPAQISIDTTFPVDIAAEADCPKYVGRVIDGVDVTKPTPLWMVEKLRRGGIRSIDPVVDITNYVLLELGQPMHAFDLDTLKDGILVRKAKSSEKLVLLDGQELTLSSDDLVIGDHEKPLALAGIMGGEGSGVSETTTRLFLESAFFEPIALAGRARSYGLHTDSSHRFERGVDYQLQERAIERATQLIVEIAGGQAGPLIINDTTSKDKKVVSLKLKRVEQLLGFSLEKEEIVRMLEGLSIDIESNEETLECTIPSFRFDLAIEADLIEEIARIYGYDNLPTTQLKLPASFYPKSESDVSLMSLKQQLVALGYGEAINYSFISKDEQADFSEGDQIEVLNPISSDMSVMRKSLLPGLVKGLAHNINRQQSRVRLFESGRTYIPALEGFAQALTLGGIIYGTVEPEGWSNNTKVVDFFDAKGDVSALLSIVGLDVDYLPCEKLGLHPGQTASIQCRGQEVGFLGALHPSIVKKQGLAQDAFVFELSLDILNKRALTEFRSISKFPSTRRDLAFVVSSDVHAGEVIEAVKENAGEYLTDCVLFDVYTGTGVEEGMKSLALGLIFQHPDKSLSDDEVQSTIDVVVSTLSQRYGATLRN